MNLLVIIFLLTYAGIIIFRNWSVVITYFSILIIFLLKYINVEQMFQSININVLSIFLTTSLISGLLYYSGITNFIVASFINTLILHIKNKKILNLTAMITLCVISGLISSFMENVAVVLLLSPLAVEIAKKLKLNPVPLLIGMSVTSNLEGCATMIGDSPSIIMAGYLKMDFLDFFFLSARNYLPGIFFAVQIGLLAGVVFLYFYFKNNKITNSVVEVSSLPEGKIKSFFPVIILVLYIATLIVISFVKDKPYYVISYVSLFYLIFALIWFLLIEKNVDEKIKILKFVDWKTVLFLSGIFILVGSLTYNGVIEKLTSDVYNFILVCPGDKKLAGYILLVSFSVLVSAFVDNIPYTIAMLPVAESLAKFFNVSPYTYIFGLLIGCCVGGNITPIGSMANVTTWGILKKCDYNVKFYEFIKLGLPFTFLSVFASASYIYLVFK